MMGAPLTLAVDTESEPSLTHNSSVIGTNTTQNSFVLWYKTVWYGITLSQTCTEPKLIHETLKSDLHFLDEL
jgi:hypothetical protein